MSHSPWFTVQLVKPNIYGIAEFAHEEEVISYLVIGDTHALLIDTGLGLQPIRPVVESLATLPVTVTHTHHHWDHIGGDHEFERFVDAQSIGAIDCAPYHFQILPCPGHSPDSVALWEPTYGYLFIGDTLYEGPLYLYLPESDMQAFSATLAVLEQIPRVSHIFPSHNTFVFAQTDIHRVLQTVRTYLASPDDFKGLSEIPIRGRLKLKFAE